MHLMGVKLYQATLYTKNGRPFSWDAPFDLELIYARPFAKKVLIKATADEIRRVEGKRADQAAFFAKIASCLQAVQKNDRLIATRMAPDEVNIRLNEGLPCVLSHKGAARRFFGIWLSKKARIRKLPRILKGMPKN